jgi:hypothetical protein
MAQHETILTPTAEEKETVQLRLPAWIWRRTKSKAALRVPHMHTGELVAEALIAHLGLTEADRDSETEKL